MIIGPRGLADGGPQVRRLSNVNILNHPLGMDPWAAAALGRMTLPPDTFVQRLDAGARILRPAGVLDALDGLWMTSSYDRAAAKLNLVPWTGTVTNALTNSEFVGAAPGVLPDGVTLTGFAAGTGNTYEIQGVDSVNGQRFIRLRLYGTSVGVGAVTFNVRSDTNVDIGQRWTSSASVELVSGSWVAGLSAVTLRLNSDGGGSNFIPGARAQYTNTRVATLASTAGNLVLRYNTPTATTTPVTYDVVLRIGMPQLVCMDVPGNYIPTSGAAASQVQTLYRFDLTEINNPTWTASAPGAPGGYTGNGTTSYLDTNANPSVDFVRMALNSACYGAWAGLNLTSNGSILGDAAGAAGVVYIRPRDPGGGVIGRINSGSGFGIDIADARGLTVLNRTGPTEAQIYKNGVNIFQAAPASSTMPTTLHLLRQAIYYPGQISAALAGASPTPAQHLAAHQGLAAILGVAA
ncbi:hypothetical protein V5F77_02345 [Xanthobacter sp. DSM 24535]|uniref:hypothetical protein n=1 Tax=Roseixanthobacter psychrophilus TaxID=3119917 RepID=UPI003727ACDC